MIVHGIALGPGTTEVAGGPVLLSDQPLDPPLYIILVITLLVVHFSPAVEGEEGKGGGGLVVVPLSPGLGDVPAPILLLGAGEVGEALVDRGFGLWSAPKLGHDLRIGEGAFTQGVEHAQLTLHDDAIRGARVHDVGLFPNDELLPGPVWILTQSFFDLFHLIDRCTQHLFRPLDRIRQFGVPK